MSTTANKTLRQFMEEGKQYIGEFKAIQAKGDDRTEADFARAAELAPLIESVGEKIAGFDNPEAMKTAEALETAFARFAQPQRPGFGGDGASGLGFTAGKSPVSNHMAAVKSIGEMFVEDERVTAWRKALTPNGYIPENIPGPSPSIAIKTLITSAIDAAADRPLLGQPARERDIVRLGWAERILRNLVTSIPTNTDLIETVREASRTNNAAGVAEATAVTGTSGEKPESGLTWEVVNVPVETVAHWVPVTTRVLDDAPRLRAEIDAFLIDGLDDAVEDAILNGNGTPPNFTGVNNATGILTQAYDAGVSQGPGIFVTTRKAKTKLMVTGKESRPTAYLFHPNDGEELDLLVDNELRYYFGGPQMAGSPVLWGVPRLESEKQPEGTGLLANWRQVVLYDRQQAMIRLGTIERQFIRNMITILAELRMAVHCRRPSSIIQIDLTA